MRNRFITCDLDEANIGIIAKETIALPIKKWWDYK
jgi:hypothetical protein